MTPKKTYLGKTPDGRDKFALDIDADPSLDYQVAGNTDDGYVYSTTGFDNTKMYLGDTGYDNNIWGRWAGVTIPVGSVIGTNTYITYRGYTKGGTLANVKTRLFFNLSGDAATPTYKADYDGKAVTVAYTDYTPDAWNNEQVRTVDCHSQIAELVAAYDFSAGKAMMALHKNNGSSANCYIQMYDYTDYTAYAVKIHIEYTAAPPAPAFKLKMIPKRPWNRMSRLYKSLSLKGG